MKSHSIVIGAVVSAVLVTTAVVLYWMAGNNSEESYRRCISIARQIQRVSSEWSLEAARVRSDPLADFDSLAAFIPRIDRLKEDLSSTVLRTPDLSDRMANDIRAYISAVDAKEERIERFKTGYAVIRNSARYLPLAATDVIQQAQEVGRSDHAAVARDISLLTREIDSYLVTPTRAVKQSSTMMLQRLREANVAYPRPLASAITNFISHAEVLLDRQAPTEEVFQEAVSPHISELTEKLVGALEFELGREGRKTAWYERGMFAAVAALLLLWVALALQRARSVPVEAQSAAGDDGVSLQAAVAVQGDRLAEPGAGSGQPVELDAEAVAQHRIMAGMIANNLATSAHRISTGMDILNQIQERMRSVLDREENSVAADDGGELDEGIEAASDVISSVRNQTNGITALASRLAAFSKKQADVGYGLINVNDCIDEVVEATRVEAVALVVRDLGNAPEIFASRTEVRLMLTNVVENSARAVEESKEKKGVIKIETTRRDGKALITIVDNGVGIAPERQKKIFNPFYTTRENQMGVGLTSTNHLVKKYDGTISVNSLPGQGTVVRIMLPTGMPAP